MSDSDASRASRRQEWLGVLGITLFAAYWVACAYPNAESFISDSDSAYQLTGALNIFSGIHPFAGFPEIYGPLTFYASALAQLLSGHRIIGEVVLISVGYGIAYGVIYQLVRRLTERRWLAAYTAVLALCLLPRIYKYYIVLGPCASLLAIWWHAEHPCRKRYWVLAMTVTACGLYRPDFGVYTFLAATGALIAGARAEWRRQVEQCLRFGLTVLACASPWLLWIGYLGGLEEYFRNSTSGVFATAAGMATPLPDFPEQGGITSLQFFEALLHRVFLTVPALGLLVLITSWRDLRPVDRQQRVALVILAQLCLIQSLHRSDWGHLLQAIPTSLVILAWLCGPIAARGYATRRVAGIAGVAAATILVLCLVPVVKAKTWPSLHPGQLQAKLMLYGRTTNEVVAEVRRRNPDNPYAATALYVSAHSSPGQTILSLPTFPQFSFLTHRLPVGGQLAVLPGYFSDSASQQRLIDAMERSDVAFVVVWRNLVFDGVPERELSRFAPLLTGYVERNFVCEARYGNFQILARAGADQP